MTRYLPAILVLLMAPWAVAAKPPQDREAAEHQRRVWQQGEVIRYSVSWLRIVGGSAEMSIGPHENGRLRIFSLAQSSPFFSRIYRVRDEVESIVDATSFTTLRFHKNLQEKNRFKEETTIIDPKKGIAFRKGNEIAVPTPIFDPLSLVYHLRTLQLVPGRTLSFTVLADDTVYSLVTEVVRRETITTDAGTFETILVEPKVRRGSLQQDEEGNRLLIWFTDDHRRIPVRLRTILSAGSITASLREYRVGPQPGDRSQ